MATMKKKVTPMIHAKTKFHDRALSCGNHTFLLYDCPVILQRGRGGDILAAREGVVKMTVNLTPFLPLSSTTSFNATYDLFSSLKSISEFLAINLLRSPVVKTCLVALTCFGQCAILLAICMAVGNLFSGKTSLKLRRMTVGVASFKTPVMTTFVCSAVQQRFFSSSCSSCPWSSWLCSPRPCTETLSSTSEKVNFTFTPQLKPFFRANRQW